ncbi:tellurite resistance protein permease [Mycobacterium heckeshornense]|uniref:tellurite resistance/C4-dicarboxylate transporter family protein n=1 Tax=Mycobacterium heckeshornense TaxID=110505 RepID=UPI0019436B1A|nr:tellurite resistance/C4-dicarboxylate transporter family protein [Mycobacterium heckeshornense]BCQ10026.1 tellurite resistance protein permease [Mycobacterium heckeshornense]
MEQINGVREAVRTLNPGYFALVMATGIVSIAMYHHRVYTLSVGLLWLTCFAYVVLLALSAVRIMAYRREFGEDLGNPGRAFGLFTFVAATDVFGTRLAIDAHHAVALALLAVGWISWLVLGYLVPWTAVLRYRHRPVLQDANGTWFIFVVASESIAVLAAALEPALGQQRRELALLAVFSWSVGVFLYGGTGVLVTGRMLLYPLRPADLNPQYWVSMGATAITVLAGARIVEMANAPMVAATRGLIAGTSVVFWAFGTWLIPPLVAAGIWKHIVHRIPLRYEAGLWSVVFPLGMYGVGGHYLGQADHLPIVRSISDIESWFALAVWVITFVAMLHHLLTIVGRPARRRARPGVAQAERKPSCQDSSASTPPAAGHPSSAIRRR